MLPNTIQALVQKFYASDGSLKVSEMDWRRRQELYEAFEQVDPKRGLLAQVWLAIITAEYVFPIFESNFAEVCYEDPEDDAYADLPTQWITLAHAVINGTAEEEAIAEYYHMAHTSMGCMINDYVSLALNAVCAAQAAYLAATIAMGFKPFQYLESYSVDQRGFVSYGSDDEPNALRGVDLDDRRLTLIGAGDAAAAAAMAFACSRTSPHYDLSKLEQFWDWWLQQAIPSAWQQAQQ